MPSPIRSRVRWWILALIFFATTINYLDRIVFSVLIPVMRQELGLDEKSYGFVNGAFQIAYTIGFLFMGKFADRVGTRIGYAVAIAWWSTAAMLHTVARTAIDLGFWRTMLGLGESGNFPVAIKAVAEWFPLRDRAFATGIFNAGASVASMIGPPVFAWMLKDLGLEWRTCFLITGSLGFIWLVVWMIYAKDPESHPDVSKEELSHIRDGGQAEQGRKLGLLEVMRYKETWGFAVGKFLTDPVWWFYIFWLPLYLHDVRKLGLKEAGWALTYVYFMADIGSVFGGWLAKYWMQRGWPYDKARLGAMLTMSALMPIASMASLVDNLFVALALVSIATGAHQGFSANLYTTVSDVFPKRAVASVMGIGGSLGGLGGVFFSSFIPAYVIPAFGYKPVMLALGWFHLLAVFLVHRIMGRLKPVTIPE